MANNSRRISGSFGPEELEVGDALLRALLVGADHRVLMRSKHFARFTRSILRLNERAQRCGPKPKLISEKRRENVVALLREHGALTRHQLAGMMQMNSVYVGQLLADLRQRGLVELTARNNDAKWTLAPETKIARLA